MLDASEGPPQCRQRPEQEWSRCGAPRITQKTRKRQASAVKFRASSDPSGESRAMSTPFLTELLSPDGTLKSMRYAYAYGADAVYAGQPRDSLRVRNNEF